MNHLKIASVDIVDLVQQYGTPLYVYDENNLEKTIESYKNNFVSKMFQTDILFASKAFSCIAIYKLIKEFGIGLDVVSGGELYTALRAHFDTSKIYFHGNNKTNHELNMALDNNVGYIVVDNYQELLYLNEMAKEKKKQVKILLRLNVGIEAHTHEYIVTAHIDSKFGIIYESDDYKNCIHLLKDNEYLLFKGFHSHIGSQIFDLKAFYIAIEKLIDILSAFKEKLILNIGGGFGVKYTDKDFPIPFDAIAKLIIEHTEKTLIQKNVAIEKLIIEPGRSIVAESGYTLYTIGYIKKTPNRKYYFIDGGMTDNIRPALYQAEYACDIANKMGALKTEKVCIAGKACESGDIIIKDVMLPEASYGDILVTYTTGAYGYSMANNYNKALTPSVVFVKDGKSRLVIKRQTYEELIEREIEG